MKTLLSVAVASIAIGVMGAQQVGVTAITTTNKNTIVSVPFTALGGGETINAKELVKTTNLAEGTQLYIFDGTSYSAWVLTSNQWQPADSSSTVNGVSVGIPADQSPLAPGSAFWLIRPTGGSSLTFYVYGTPWTPTAKTIAEGYNLVANPRQAAATFTVAGAAAGDQILIPNDNDSEIYTYRTSKSGSSAWRKGNRSVELPEIPVGLGFWYIRSEGSGSTTITWSNQ